MSNEFAEERRFADWRLALKSILGFWLVYAATVVARALLGDDPWTALHNKAPNIVAGTLLTFVHSGLPEAAVGPHIEGWTHYLGRLAMAAAGRDPGPDPNLKSA